MLKRRVTHALVEQILNTAWNFLIGVLIARLGGVSVFGAYASMMAVYFILAGPVGAMTTSIVSVDIARLHRARPQYLLAAGLGSERIVLAVLPLAFMVIVGQGLKLTIDHAGAAIALGCVYVATSFLADLWRRNLVLGDQSSALVAASALRLAALAVCVGLALFFASKDRVLDVVVVAIAAVSVVYLVVLRFVIGLATPQRMRMRRVSLRRQLRFGTWGFVSALVMYGLDQGLMIYLGLIGRSEIAGQLRAASYLFGLMNPVMLVFDLLVPGIIATYLGRNPALPHILPLVALGATAGAAIGGAIAFASAQIWLPMLGDAYRPYAPLAYWYGAAFACMLTRSCVMPFLKTRAPRSIFAGAIAGTAGGLLVAFAQPSLDATAVCNALLTSAMLLLSTGLMTLVLLYKRSTRPAHV